MTTFNQSKTVCFTGHRSIDKSKIQPVVKSAANIILELLEKGYTDFIFGGAVGFDTFAFKTAYFAKTLPGNEYMRLHLFIPYEGHTKRWSPREIKFFEDTVKLADSIRYISDKNSRYVYHERNRAMVDNSSALVAYCNSSGGSAYTVSYALKKKIPVYFVEGSITDPTFYKGKA